MFYFAPPLPSFTAEDIIYVSLSLSNNRDEESKSTDHQKYMVVGIFRISE
jgi:hypothetical protein